MGVWPRRALVAPRLGPEGDLPPAIATSFEKALIYFARASGLTPEPADLGSAFAAGDPDADWFTICAVEELHAFGRRRLGEDADRLSPVFRAVLEIADGIDIDAYLDAKRRRFAYVRAVDEALGRDAVLLSPTMCVEGFAVDGRMPGADRAGTPMQAYNTQLANMTGHPALSVPAGMSANGVPFGLQITGPRFADDLVLTVGATWETAAPWPVAAPGYDEFGP
jgi:Asp-tRNA(Asn)/Glu-tRNA(Gln) amidotransferase A subunit family amidase